MGDISRYKTAWDLCGDSDWLFYGYSFRLKNGKAIYESASPSRTQQTVLIQYLTPVGHVVRVVKRYVHPDTPVELMEVGSG